MRSTKSVWVLTAAFFWFLAGFLYLASETYAVAGWPGYSYAEDYISDLGIPYADEGRLASPRAVDMNLAFILEGICFALAALAYARGDPPRGPLAFVFLLLGASHSLGLVLIAIVHGGSRELADGSFRWHSLGAGMAIVGGNLAILAASRLFRRFGLPPAFCAASLVLGLIGLTSLALLLAELPQIPVGLAERGSVYAIAAWEIVTGLVLFAWARRSRTA